MQLPFRVGISKELQGIRAIIATEKIQKGQVVESCPVIVIPRTQEDNLAKTLLNFYYYEWNEGNVVIILGYGSIFNHSYTPNCYYHRDFAKKELQYIALRDIKAGEELTVNYNGTPDNKTPVGEEYTNFSY